MWCLLLRWAFDSVIVFKVVDGFVVAYDKPKHFVLAVEVLEVITILMPKRDAVLVEH